MKFNGARIGVDYSNGAHQHIGTVVRQFPKAKRDAYHAWRKRRLRDLMHERGFVKGKHMPGHAWRALDDIVNSPTFIVECMTKVGEIAGES